MSKASVSEMELLANTVEEILAAHHASIRTRKENWNPELWEALEGAGLTLVGLGEASGGSGGSAAEAAVILKAAGRHAASIPLAETMLAAWMVESVGGHIPKTPLAVATGFTIETSGRYRLITGTALAVPWARVARRLALLADDGDESFVVVVDPDECHLAFGENLAGEPRDDITADGVAAEMVFPSPARIDADAILCRGALHQATLMAGALEKLLRMTLGYAWERHQFGRPIEEFQVIQHNLAILAEEVAAATAAVDLAVGAADSPLMAAIAKIRVGEAAGKVTAIAHQIHGAIGITEEHPLHRWSRRLWSWRDEFGHEAYWSAKLGWMIAGVSSDEIWPLITSRP